MTAHLKVIIFTLLFCYTLLKVDAQDTTFVDTSDHKEQLMLLQMALEHPDVEDIFGNAKKEMGLPIVILENDLVKKGIFLYCRGTEVIIASEEEITEKTKSGGGWRMKIYQININEEEDRAFISFKYSTRDDSVVNMVTVNFEKRWKVKNVGANKIIHN